MYRGVTDHYLTKVDKNLQVLVGESLISWSNLHFVSYSERKELWHVGVGDVLILLKIQVMSVFFIITPEYLHEPLEGPICI